MLSRFSINFNHLSFISFTTICDKKYLIRLKSKRFSCGISTHLMQLTVLCEYHSKYPLLSINRDTCVYESIVRLKQAFTLDRVCVLTTEIIDSKRTQPELDWKLNILYQICCVILAPRNGMQICSFLNIFKPVFENNLTSNF